MTVDHRELTNLSTYVSNVYVILSAYNTRKLNGLDRYIHSRIGLVFIQVLSLIIASTSLKFNFIILGTYCW